MAKGEKRERRGGDRERERERNQEPELIEKLVGINRVAKVVKGGKRFGFAAIVVAGDGTGIIAGGPVRAICEALGIHDVVAKSVGTSNPHNMIKAAFDALSRSNSPRSVAARRGKKVSEIIGKRGAEADARE